MQNYPQQTDNSLIFSVILLLEAYSELKANYLLIQKLHGLVHANFTLIYGNEDFK